MHLSLASQSFLGCTLSPTTPHAARTLPPQSYPCTPRGSRAGACPSDRPWPAPCRCCRWTTAAPWAPARSVEPARPRNSMGCCSTPLLTCIGIGGFSCLPILPLSYCTTVSHIDFPPTGNLEASLGPKIALHIAREACASSIPICTHRQQRRRFKVAVLGGQLLGRVAVLHVYQHKPTIFYLNKSCGAQTASPHKNSIPAHRTCIPRPGHWHRRRGSAGPASLRGGPAWPHSAAASSCSVCTISNSKLLIVALPSSPGRPERHWTCWPAPHPRV